MNSKIDKKFQHNSKILEQWHASITKYYVLSPREAKQLMRLFLNEKDEKKKVGIRNVIVLGTLEYIYQFLKQSVFINLICNWFDMEDVINATVEAWIKFISKEQINSRAHLYTIDSEYTLYGQTFLNHILSNLCSSNTLSFVNKRVVNDFRELTNWYYLYLNNKKDKTSFSFVDFKKVIWSYTNKLNEKSLLKIYNAFKYLDNVFGIKEENLTLEVINKLKYFLYFGCNMAPFNNNLVYDEKTMINRLLCQDLIEQIFGDNDILTPKKRELLAKLFVEGRNEISIAQENNVCHQSVNDLKRRTLEKIKKKYQDLELD